MPLELVQQVAHKARVPATMRITVPHIISIGIIIQSDRNDVVVDGADRDVLLREVQAQLVGVVHLDTTQARQIVVSRQRGVDGDLRCFDVIVEYCMVNSFVMYGESLHSQIINQHGQHR